MQNGKKNRCPAQNVNRQQTSQRSAGGATWDNIQAIVLKLC
jgi:hypothetical protein